MNNNFLELLRDLGGIIVGSAIYKPIDRIKDIDVWLPSNFYSAICNILFNNTFEYLEVMDHPLSQINDCYANIISFKYNEMYNIDLIFSNNKPAKEYRKKITINNVVFPICTEYSHKLHRFLNYSLEANKRKYPNLNDMNILLNNPLLVTYKKALKKIRVCAKWDLKIKSFIEVNSKLYPKPNIKTILGNAWIEASLNNVNDDFLQMLKSVTDSQCILESSIGKHFSGISDLQKIVDKYDYSYWLPVIKPNKKFIIDFDNSYEKVPLYIELFHKLDDKKRKHVKIGTCCYTVHKEYRLNDEDIEILWEDIKITNILR